MIPVKPSVLSVSRSSVSGLSVAESISSRPIIIPTLWPDPIMAQTLTSPLIISLSGFTIKQQLLPVLRPVWQVRRGLPQAITLRGGRACTASAPDSPRHVSSRESRFTIIALSGQVRRGLPPSDYVTRRDLWTCQFTSYQRRRTCHRCCCCCRMRWAFWTEA